MTRRPTESGFSLVELLFATGILLIVSSIVTTALLQMTNSQKTIWNRTEMHSGIRGATELLQQEVGQAGRIATPATVTLIDAVDAGMIHPTCDGATPTVGAVNVRISSSVGLWAVPGTNPSYVMLTTMDGNNQESFRVATITAGTPYPTISGCFTRTHLVGAVLMPLGAFATGIVPKTGVTNGSSDTVLKLFGDINSDGNMVYVEYVCDTSPGVEKLYRNVMPFTQPVATKPAVNDSMILLANVKPNPGNAPCFTYQQKAININGTTFTFVLDVAITLTVETEQVDPLTNARQTETKALLNVSPRNVFLAWAFATSGYTDRVQSTPSTVQALVCAGYGGGTCP
jgi:type II secretory pathway pseudopilin PulG